MVLPDFGFDSADSVWRDDHFYRFQFASAYSGDTMPVEGIFISVLPDSGLVGMMPIVRQNKKFPYPFLRHIDKAAACMI